MLEQAAQTLGSTEQLATHVADRRMLLFLDNFEHVLEAAPAVAGLLGACPSLDLVVTSRELLQVQAEHTYSVPALAARDGMELFLARARAGSSHLEGNGVVRELCERLDNLPSRSSSRRRGRDTSRPSSYSTGSRSASTY